MHDRGATGPEEAEPIVYPVPEDVIGFHAELFSISPDQAALRLRNRSGLESALLRPRQHALYADADVALQAAVLAHGIAEGQTFVDGNKRTTLITLCAFLKANGYEFVLGDSELALLILDLSRGLTVDGLGERIRASLLTIEGG